MIRVATEYVKGTPDKQEQSYLRVEIRGDLARRSNLKPRDQLEMTINGLQVAVRYVEKFSKLSGHIERRVVGQAGKPEFRIKERWIEGEISHERQAKEVPFEITSDGWLLFDIPAEMVKEKKGFAGLAPEQKGFSFAA